MPPPSIVGNLFLTKVSSFRDIRHTFQLDDMNTLRNYLVGMGFLLLNIFLGLLGTFWFRTQQRKGEMALMMAVGGSKQSVFLSFAERRLVYASSGYSVGYWCRFLYRKE